MAGRHIFLLGALCLTTLIIIHGGDAAPPYPQDDSTEDTNVKDDNLSGVLGQMTETENQKMESMEEPAGDAAPPYTQDDSTEDTNLKDDNLSGVLGQMTEAENQKMESMEEPAGHSAFKVETKCLEGWNEWNGVCYFFEFNTHKTWAQAHGDCIKRSQGQGDLASIHSQQEHAFVIIMGITEGTWIGLYLDTATHAEKNFKWSDNTPKDYTNWYKNQPDNSRGAERCGVISNLYDGKFNDVSCYLGLHYICKAPKITFYSGLVEAP